ncbi:MAG: acyl-CoA dehydrogenase [Myxococcales bacterium]|nr:acyl-CoA dehydrogenase [Myxococcales bacterium]
MRFAFSDEQRQFQRSVRELLARQCPPAEVRAAWSSESGRSTSRWDSLVEVGAVGLLAPLDWVLPLEEAGRAALPEPLLETTAVALPLLAAVQALAESLDHGAILTVGLDGALVTDAHVADLVLLADGDALHAVAPSKLQLQAAPSVDGARRLYRVAWKPSDATLVATDCGAALADAFDRGALAASAQLVGLAARLLEMTVEYVKVRRQFGQAVGAFQAVKHQLADALVAIELARPLVYYAAYTVTQRRESRSTDVSMAKAAASDAALETARVALQCHGAIGYSFEHDLHLWMKRVWALAAAWGDAEHHRARVAAALLDGESGPRRIQ